MGKDNLIGLISFIIIIIISLGYREVYIYYRRKDNSEKKSIIKALIIFIITFLISLLFIPFIIVPPFHYFFKNLRNSKLELLNSFQLGIFVYGLTLVFIPVFVHFKINLFWLLIVFTMAIIFTVILSSIVLINNDKISERTYLNLMLIVLKKIPGIGFLTSFIK